MCGATITTRSGTTSRRSTSGSLMPTTRSAPFSSEFLAQLERLALLSRRTFRGRVRGERRSPRRGHSVEFCDYRSEEHTSELQSRLHLVCRLLLEKKKTEH